MIHLHRPKYRLFYLNKPLGSTLPTPSKSDKVVTLSDLGNKAIQDSGAHAVGKSGRLNAANNIVTFGTKKEESIAVGSSHKNSDVVTISSQTRKSDFQERTTTKSKQNNQSQSITLPNSNSTDQEPKPTAIGTTQAIGIGQSSKSLNITSEGAETPKVSLGIRQESIAKLDIQSFAKIGSNVSIQDYPRANWNSIFDKQKDLKLKITLTDEQITQLVNPKTRSLNKDYSLSFFYILNGTRKYLPKPILNSEGRSYYLFLNFNTGSATNRKDSRLLYVEDQFNRDKTQFAQVAAIRVRQSVATAGPDIFADDKEVAQIDSDGVYIVRTQTNAERASNENRATQQEVEVPNIATDVLAGEVVQESGLSNQPSDYSDKVTGLSQDVVTTQSIESTDINSVGKVNTNNYSTSELNELSSDNLTQGAKGVGDQAAAVGVGAIGVVSSGVVAASIGAGQAGAVAVGIGANSSLRTPTGANATISNQSANSKIELIAAKRAAAQKGFGVITKEEKANKLKELHEVAKVNDPAGFELDQVIASALIEGRHEDFHFHPDGSVVHKETGQVIKQGTVLASGDGQLAQLGLNTEGLSSDAIQYSNQSLRDFAQVNNNVGGSFDSGVIGLNMASFGAAAIPLASQFLGANPSFIPGQSSPVGYFNSGNYVLGQLTSGFGSSGSTASGGERIDRSGYTEGVPRGVGISASDLNSGGGNNGKPPKSPKVTGGGGSSDDPWFLGKDEDGNNFFDPNYTPPGITEDGKIPNDVDYGSFGAGLGPNSFKIRSTEQTKQGQPYQDNNRLAEEGDWLDRFKNNLKNGPRIVKRIAESTIPNFVSKSGLSNAKTAASNLGNSLQQPVSAQNAIAAARAAMAAISAALGVFANPAFWLLMAILLGLVMGATLLIGSYCIKAEPFPAIRNTIMEPAMWAGSLASGNPLQKAGALANLGINGLGGVLNGTALSGEQLLPPSEFRKMIETALACKDKGGDNCSVDGAGTVRNAAGADVTLGVDNISCLAGRNSIPEPELRAFMRALTYAEGTSGVDGYTTLVGGKVIKQNFHPGVEDPRLYSKTGFNSDAYGKYQFLSTTWNPWAADAGVPLVPGKANNSEGEKFYDMSPQYQDLAVANYLRKSPVVSRLQAGDIIGAVNTDQACQWASVPGNRPGCSQGNPKSKDFIPLYTKLLVEEKSPGGCGKTARLDSLNSHFKDQRANWQKTRDDYFAKVFGIPVNVTDGQKQAKASGNKVIDDMMRAFNTEMKGGLTVEAQTVNSSLESQKTERNELVQLADAGKISIQNPSDKKEILNGFTHINIVKIQLALYRAGIGFRTGSNDYVNAASGRSSTRGGGSQHYLGQAVDFVALSNGDWNNSTEQFYYDSSGSNQKAVDLFRKANSIARSTGAINQLIGPTYLITGENKVDFTDSGHQDHLHIGIKADANFSNPSTSSGNLTGGDKCCKCTKDGNSPSGISNNVNVDKSQIANPTNKDTLKDPKFAVIHYTATAGSAESMASVLKDRAEKPAGSTEDDDWYQYVIGLDGKSYQIIPDNLVAAGAGAEYSGIFSNGKRVTDPNKANKNTTNFHSVHYGLHYLPENKVMPTEKVTDEQLKSLAGLIKAGGFGKDSVLTHWSVQPESRSDASDWIRPDGQVTKSLKSFVKYMGWATDEASADKAAKEFLLRNINNALSVYEDSEIKRGPSVTIRLDVLKLGRDNLTKKSSWLEDIIQKGLSFGSDIGINSPSILASAQSATPTSATTTSKPAIPNSQPSSSPTPSSSGDCGGGNVGNGGSSGGAVGKIDLSKLTENQGALAMIAILEGGPNRPVQEHLDVAQAMANRAGNNFDNFGKTVVSQAFAPNQFKVIPDYSVKPSDITSYDGLLALLKKAKNYDGSNDIKNFFTALQDPTRVADSEKFVGGRVYFKASTSAVGGLRQGEVQRSKDSNFFHPPDNQNDKTVYKTINIASVIGGSTGTENIANKPTDTKPTFLPNWLTGNLRVDAQTQSVPTTIVDREFDALYFHDIQKITDPKYDSPSENKIYVDSKNTNLKVGDRVRLIIAVNPNGTIGEAEKNKIVIYDVAKKVDLGDDGGLMPIRLPKSDITKFVTAVPRMGGLYKFKLYKVKEEDKNSTTVGAFNKPVTNADVNCPNGSVEGNSADGLADNDFAGIMKKISTVYNKQCGSYIDSQKIIGKAGVGWQTKDLRPPSGTGCCYGAVWAGLLINKLGNPNSAWAKAFPVIDSATGNTGSYAVDFHKAMQLTSSSGKKYYEEAGLIFSTDLASAPIGAIAVVNDVSPPYGDINVKTGANEYVNYATMGFMSDKKTALGVYYPKK